MKFKKTAALLLTASITLLSALPAFAAEGVIIGGRTLIPVRGVFEELGFDVEWDNDTQSAYILDYYGNMSICVPKGASYIDVSVVGQSGYLSTESYYPDVPQQIIDGHFYIPLRAVAEMIGADVGWDQYSKTATVSYGSDIVYVYCGGGYGDPVYEEPEYNPTSVYDVVPDYYVYPAGSYEDGYSVNIFSYYDDGSEGNIIHYNTEGLLYSTSDNPNIYYVSGGDLDDRIIGFDDYGMYVEGSDGISEYYALEYNYDMP